MNMIRALVASVVLMMPLTSFANEGIFVCTALNPDGTCGTFEAVLDGVASFEEIGITTEGIGYAMGFGLGAVVAFFALGLGIGSAHRVLNIALGATHYD